MCSPPRSRGAWDGSPCPPESRGDDFNNHSVPHEGALHI
jgi:hypothetical protein